MSAEFRLYPHESFVWRECTCRLWKDSPNICRGW